MKHKIQTTCHSELVEGSHHITTCRSELVEGSHHTNYFVTSSLSRSHSLINKLTHRLSLSCFLILISCISFAQEYDWQWAKSGGGEMGNTAFTFSKNLDEHVWDIAVDSNNNYYYLMRVYGNSPMYHDDVLPEDIALEHYGGKDILLLSTDEEGNYRWHQVIGGFSDDGAYNVVVDSENGVYVNVSLINSTEGSAYNVTHLSAEVTLPQTPAGWDYEEPHSSYQRIFLIKYAQSDGSLLDYKAYQGEVNAFNSLARYSNLWIDSANHLHAYVSLRNGTHLDGLVTIDDVDETDYEDYRTYLVELDTSLNIIGTPRAFSIKGTLTRSSFFVYDEALNRYYIGGIKDGPQELAYDGVEIEEKAFILAIDGETLAEEWRSGFNVTPNPVDELYSMYIDDSHNIYLSGMYPYNSFSSTLQERYFGDYELSVNVGGESFARVPYTIKLNSEGKVQWVAVPDGYTNNSANARNINYDVTVKNGEVITVPNSRAALWGDYEITSEYSTVPSVVRLNPETGEVIGATHVEGFGSFTKVVGDQNGDLVLGGYFFGEMFSENDEVPTLQSPNNYTDFFITKLHIDRESSADDYALAHMKVYPNPTTDIVYFETEEKFTYYTVYNQYGQQVQVHTQVNDDNYQMSLAGLASGVYHVLIRTESGKNFSVKVVKE